MAISRLNKSKKKCVGRTDLKLDALGFGCAPLGNLYQAISDGQAYELLSSAIQSGFTYFDTAPHYGQGLSERRLGDYLRVNDRSQFTLSTKVGRLLTPAGLKKERHGFVSPMPFDSKYDYSYDGVMRSYEDSIQRLGLDSIDILYMHDIGRACHGRDGDYLFDIAMRGGYKALDELRSQGLIKAFGLGVNEIEVCEQALEFGDWDCFLLAGRYSLLEQHALDSLFPKCLQRGSSIVIGGPYNSGILATGTKGSAPFYFDYKPASNAIINKVSAIESICDEFAIPMAAAALQFPLAHPAVISVIPGIGKPSRIDSTISLFNLSIPDEFWMRLKALEFFNSQAPVPGE